jgi:hypothetical protein
MIHWLLRSAPAQSQGPRSDDDAPARGPASAGRAPPAPGHNAGPALGGPGPAFLSRCLRPGAHSRRLGARRSTAPATRCHRAAGPVGPRRRGENAFCPVSRRGGGRRVTESTVTVTARSRIYTLIGLRRHKFGLRCHDELRGGSVLSPGHGQVTSQKKTCL